MGECVGDRTVGPAPVQVRPLPVVLRRKRAEVPVWTAVAEIAVPRATVGPVDTLGLVHHRDLALQSIPRQVDVADVTAGAGVAVAVDRDQDLFHQSKAGLDAHGEALLHTSVHEGRIVDLPLLVDPIKIGHHRYHAMTASLREGRLKTDCPTPNALAMTIRWMSILEVCVFIRKLVPKTYYIGPLL